VSEPHEQTLESKSSKAKQILSKESSFHPKKLKQNEYTSQDKSKSVLECDQNSNKLCEASSNTSGNTTGPLQSECIPSDDPICLADNIVMLPEAHTSELSNSQPSGSATGASKSRNHEDKQSENEIGRGTIYCT